MGSVNMLSQCFNQCGPRRGCKLGFIWNKLVAERRTSMETTCEDITLDEESSTPRGAICEDIILVGERHTPMETTCEDITLVGERHMPMETICEGITLVGERGTPMETICQEILIDKRLVDSSEFDDAMRIICEDIKGKAAGPFVAARMRELYDARGDRALEETNCRELMTYIRDFEYENTLLIWHIATEICINIEGEEDNVDQSDRKRKLSKKLSDYLIYLLVGQPKLMSAVAGTSQIRYKDTCVELKFLRRRFGSQTMREFCASIVKEYANITESSIKGNNHVHSVLKDACGLVQLLLQRGKDNRWDAIHKVWLELLSYAAGHCRVGSHLRMLSEGGEFLTFVWMLMAFCGIRDQFPVK